MSADNWTTCPACAHKKSQELAGEQDHVDAMYGTVSVEEFDAARAALQERRMKPMDETFREDYEFWGAHEGTLHVSYEGRCTVCGTGTKHEDAIKFWSPS